MDHPPPAMHPSRDAEEAEAVHDTDAPATTAAVAAAAAAADSDGGDGGGGAGSPARSVSSVGAVVGAATAAVADHRAHAATPENVFDTLTHTLHAVHGYPRVLLAMCTLPQLTSLLAAENARNSAGEHADADAGAAAAAAPAASQRCTTAREDEQLALRFIADRTGIDERELVQSLVHAQFVAEARRAVETQIARPTPIRPATPAAPSEHSASAQRDASAAARDVAVPAHESPRAAAETTRADAHVEQRSIAPMEHHQAEQEQARQTQRSPHQREQSLSPQQQRVSPPTRRTSPHPYHNPATGQQQRRSPLPQRRSPQQQPAMQQQPNAQQQRRSPQQRSRSPHEQRSSPQEHPARDPREQPHAVSQGQYLPETLPYDRARSPGQHHGQHRPRGRQQLNPRLSADHRQFRSMDGGLDIRRMGSPPGHPGVSGQLADDPRLYGLQDRGPGAGFYPLHRSVTDTFNPVHLMQGSGFPPDARREMARYHADMEHMRQVAEAQGRGDPAPYEMGPERDRLYRSSPVTPEFLHGPPMSSADQLPYQMHGEAPDMSWDGFLFVPEPSGEQAAVNRVGAEQHAAVSRIADDLHPRQRPRAQEIEPHYTNVGDPSLGYPTRASRPHGQSGGYRSWPEKHQASRGIERRQGMSPERNMHVAKDNVAYPAAPRQQGSRPGRRGPFPSRADDAQQRRRGHRAYGDHRAASALQRVDPGASLDATMERKQFAEMAMEMQKQGRAQPRAAPRTEADLAPDSDRELTQRPRVRLASPPPSPPMSPSSPPVEAPIVIEMLQRLSSSGPLPRPKHAASSSRDRMRRSASMPAAHAHSSLRITTPVEEVMQDADQLKREIRRSGRQPTRQEQALLDIREERRKQLHHREKNLLRERQNFIRQEEEIEKAYAAAGYPDPMQMGRGMSGGFGGLQFPVVPPPRPNMAMRPAMHAGPMMGPPVGHHVPSGGRMLLGMEPQEGYNVASFAPGLPQPGDTPLMPMFGPGEEDMDFRQGDVRHSMHLEQTGLDLASPMHRPGSHSMLSPEDSWPLVSAPNTKDYIQASFVTDELWPGDFSLEQ